MQLSWRHLRCERWHWRRVRYAPGSGIAEHGHDFAECFLIEDGGGLQDLAGQADAVTLQAGDLVFVHPGVCHALRARTDTSMTLSNLAVPATLHADLHQRFFVGRSDWPWSEQAAAEPLHLAAEDRRAALDWMAELERPGAEKAHPDLLVQTLLADLLRRALRRRGEDALLGCPDWLRESIEIFDEPRYYGSGVQGLARIAGVGREHLSRSIRRHLDCTAGELINRLRLAWVRKQLACTNHPIQDIALDAGFGNLAHFHRLFRQTTDETPGGYRRRMTRSIV